MYAKILGVDKVAILIDFHRFYAINIKNTLLFHLSVDYNLKPPRILQEREQVIDNHE